MPESADWTERYRPQNLDEVAGMVKGKEDLRAWARAWTKGTPELRAVILIGPPGTGKTSAAHALAKENGWTVVELNASDARNRDAIERIILRGAEQETISSTGAFERTRDGKLKLLLLDEADQLAGRDETMGGKKAILTAVQRTGQPIILTANDEEMLKKSKALKDQSLVIKFQRLREGTIEKALQRVCQAEGIAAEPEALLALATKAEGDLRGAIRDLQALCIGRTTLTLKDIRAVGERNRTATLWEFIKNTYRTSDIKAAREMSWDVDEEPREKLTWLDDNLPRAYRDVHDVAQGLEFLSRADVFLARTSRTQNYRLWGYANDLMVAGVAASKHAPMDREPWVEFPSWIRRMGASRHARGMRGSLAEKLGKATHTGSDAAEEAFLPWLLGIFRNDREQAVRLAVRLDLEEAEMAWLLGDAPRTEVTKFLARVEALREPQAEVVEEEAPEPEPVKEEAKPAPEPKAKQKGLFEF
ncbi:MAG: replication factor C large subunit [Halobacteriales archaeon]|nr:replication factor C large subunit [Halobacteriales archaeon]